MDPKFKEWIIKDSANWPAETRRQILRMLKFEPRKFFHSVLDDLKDWGTRYTMSTSHTLASCDKDDDAAKELIEALEQHFASELAEIV